jgi:hypothetical protein
VSRPKVRLLCDVHNGRTVGRIEEDGTYVSERPWPKGQRGTLLLGDDGTIGARRRDHRLPEAKLLDRVRLDDPHAMAYTSSPAHWGTLPAWCPDCNAERWLAVEDLRAASSGPHSVLNVQLDGMLSSARTRDRPGRVAQ